jgi:hypothetical protein
MSKIALEGNASGTGTFTLASPNSSTDRTLTLPDNTGTIITTASTFAGTGPAFSAYQSSATSLSSGAFTKVLFGTEEFDTNNNFTSSTFTPTVAGYYQVNGSVNIDTITGLTITTIYKNGSRYKDGVWLNVVSNQAKSLVSSVVYCNGTTDYLELYAFNGGSTANTVNIAVQGSYFNAVLVRAA